jgi:hypothetical protein
MAKGRKHMPKGRGWQLHFNGKHVGATLLLKKRVSDRASIVVFKARTPKTKRT